MPFTGAWSPSPTRTGGGDSGNGVTLLQRVFESIASQRGDAYDQTINTAVGIENMAYARAITFEGWGANQRTANNVLPSKSSLATGTLQRWERILGKPPLPGDSERIRRARVVAAWGRIGDPNSIQPIVDALQSALGPIYVGVVHQTTATETEYIGGLSNVVATGTTPPAVRISGTPLLTDYFEIDITTGGAVGTALFTWKRHGSNVATAQVTSGAFALPGTGVVVKFNPGTYATNNVYKFTTLPLVPWMSSLAHVDVQITQSVAGYHNADGSPNAAFYNLAASINPILDEALPMWATFDWFIADSAGFAAFRLDEHNLDLEVFGS